MAKVTYVDLTTEQEVPFYSGLTAQDRFTFARLTRKVTLLSKKKVVGLTARSILPTIAAAWNALSEAEQAAWTTAGGECALNGYRLFVKDKAARIRNELAGNATPTTLHQVFVGNLHIEAPATNLKIVQLHPRAYWISQKVAGKKGMYQPVVVTEDLALPLEISLNYRAELTAAGPSPSARYYAKVWRSYQGQDLFTYLQIALDLSCDWKNALADLNSVVGTLISYDLYFELVDVEGDLYIDNVKSTHSGQNWVRDPYCQDIDQDFTRAFYQIPKHWAVVDVPDGAWYNSIYKDF